MSKPTIQAIKVLDNDMAETYNFTIVVTNDNNNSAKDTAYIAITDTTNTNVIAI